MPTYRHGALYVVETAAQTEPILRQLKELDRSLFLERQLTLDEEMVWCVCVTVDGDQPPVTLLEWRDSDGNPIDLSSGIVERMRAMSRDAERLVGDVQRANDARKRSATTRATEAYQEIARDMIPRIQGRGRPVLPRGVYLRQSRDRRRAQGERI